MRILSFFIRFVSDKIMGSRLGIFILSFPLQLATLMVSKGAQVNEPDKNLFTSVHLAAQTDNEQVPPPS